MNAPRLAVSPTVALLLLTLIFSVQPVADAAAARAPPTVIIDVLDFVANQTTGAWVATLNVSIERSPDDPGTWHYSLNYTPDLSECNAAPFCWNDARYLTVSIGQRPGWAWLGSLSTFGGNEVFTDGAQSFLPESQFWGVRNFTVYANETVTGTPSCTLHIDLKQFDLGMYAGPIGGVAGTDDGVFSSLSHKVPNEAGLKPYYACGVNATLDPPSGVQARVEDAYAENGATANTTGTSTTNVTWAASPDDASFTFDYYVLHRYTNPPALSAFYSMTRDSTTDGLDVAGLLHSKEIVGSGFTGKLDPMWVSVVVRDNLTHQQSYDSCAVGVIQGQRDSVAGCDSLTVPLFTAAEISPTPVFPMLGSSVGTWSTRVGLSAFAGQLVLGIVFMMFCACMGALIMRVPGMIGGSVVGFVGSVIFGLFPTWLLFAAFAMFVAMIVISRQGGQQA